MILTKYDEAMEQIKLTPQMRERVLENVEKKLAHSPPQKRPAAKLYRFGALAACLAVLLLGALSLPRLISRPTREEPEVMVANGIQTLSSREELSDAVGFPVKSADTLPFFPQEIHYTSYWGDMAQIDYVNEGASACFRQSAGEEDNSGDWNEYPAQEELTAGSCAVTLKGASGSYTLAVWSDGTYSYSLSLSSGQPLTVWQAIIEGVR